MVINMSKTSVAFLPRWQLLHCSAYLLSTGCAAAVYAGSWMNISLLFDAYRRRQRRQDNMITMHYDGAPFKWNVGNNTLFLEKFVLSLGRVAPLQPGHVTCNPYIFSQLTSSSSWLTIEWHCGLVYISLHAGMTNVSPSKWVDCFSFLTTFSTTTLANAHIASGARLLLCCFWNELLLMISVTWLQNCWAGKSLVVSLIISFVVIDDICGSFTGRFCLAKNAWVDSGVMCQELAFSSGLRGVWKCCCNVLSIFACCIITGDCPLVQQLFMQSGWCPLCDILSANLALHTPQFFSGSKARPPKSVNWPTFLLWLSACSRYVRSCSVRRLCDAPLGLANRARWVIHFSYSSYRMLLSTMSTRVTE